MEQNTRDLVTIDQLSARLNIGTSKIRALVRDGVLPQIKLGSRCVRYVASDCEQAIASLATTEGSK